MKCPFCAEEIQDAAILCRFCGATQQDGRWIAAGRAGAPRPASRPGTLTMKSAGALYLLSAVFEVFSMTSAVPLFGEVRGGVAAILFHTIYLGVFVAMGVGLWVPKPWGVRAVLGGTVFYTLQKAIYVLDRGAREAEIMGAIGGHREVLDLIGKGSLLQIGVTSAVVLVACWWGFAIYVYFRRDYFAV